MRKQMQRPRSFRRNSATPGYLNTASSIIAPIYLLLLNVSPSGNFPDLFIKAIEWLRRYTASSTPLQRQEEPAGRVFQASRPFSRAPEQRPGDFEALTNSGRRRERVPSVRRARGGLGAEIRGHLATLAP